MNTSTKLLICVLASLVLVGCESYRQPVRSFTHATGGIMIGDIRQANELQGSLPAYLGLPSSRIQVEAGSGVTDVTIFRVSSPADRLVITTKIQDLQTQNPKMNPINLKFQG